MNTTFRVSNLRVLFSQYEDVTDVGVGAEKVNRMDREEAEQRRGMCLTIDAIWIVYLRGLKLSEPWEEGYIF